MACPFFFPVSRFENGSWPHPGRLPLGAGWTGQCTAPSHEADVLSPEEIQQFCNLGYADSCRRLPADRACDAVRLAVASVRETDPTAAPAQRIQIRYVCERAHRPADHGLLEFDLATSQWLRTHPDHRVQKMAECFLETYLQKMRAQQ